MTEINFAYYAQGHTPYVSYYTIGDVIKLREEEPLNLSKWFIGNPLETNNNKYYLITNMKCCVNLKIEIKTLKTVLV